MSSAITLVLIVVFLLLVKIIPCVESLDSIISSLNNIPLFPVPITEHKIGSAPRAFKLSATFAAPPNLFSCFFISTTGTGASGDMRFISPHMYASIIASPTTRTFLSLNP